MRRLLQKWFLLSFFIILTFRNIFFDCILYITAIIVCNINYLLIDFKTTKETIASIEKIYVCTSKFSSGSHTKTINISHWAKPQTTKPWTLNRVYCAFKLSNGSFLHQNFPFSQQVCQMIDRRIIQILHLTMWYLFIQLKCFASTIYLIWMSLLLPVEIWTNCITSNLYSKQTHCLLSPHVIWVSLGNY